MITASDLLQAHRRYEAKQDAAYRAYETAFSKGSIAHCKNQYRRAIKASMRKTQAERVWLLLEGD